MTSSFERIVTANQPTKVEPLKSGKSGALVATYRGGLRAVLKPVKEKMPNGKRTQRELPVTSHPYRERAYYKLARLLGCEDIVPETVLTTYRGVDASAQVFTQAMHLSEINPKLKDYRSPEWKSELASTARMVPMRYWRKLLLLDIIAGSRDRHANNIGVIMQIQNDRPAYRLVAWDNAVTFGTTFELYHNVFHKFLFRRHVDLINEWDTIDGITHKQLSDTLEGLISDEEIAHAYKRLTFFRDDFPYRLPWRICSQRNDGPRDFPAYASYFLDENPVNRPTAVSA